MARLATLEPVLDILFPPRCPLCGAALAQQGGLCSACWSELVHPTEPCCSRCQRPLAATIADSAAQDGAEDGGEDGGGPVCAPCLARPPLHDGICAATLYTAPSRKLVLAFKHGRRVALGRLLARMMAARIPPLAGEWLVVPVPLHRWRLWQRGYNQSAVLAEHIARALGQPLVVDALQRTVRTPSLGGLDRAARAQVLAGAIRAHPARVARLAGARVLLVDDVLTSGATSDACIRALRRAGVAQVRIVCFARVLELGIDDPRVMVR
ncbi:ComF family protein [Novosphingobium huizhouense]|uniref:ComF family protein n=1 Tax=Novosphingobium huizhouense TaxID=2866625 RepID=UPI001CD8316A|nr:ComF family protein [Novosphingobium huizhouense]